MGKGIRKTVRHIRRGEGFRRDHRGVHRNIINPKGSGTRQAAKKSTFNTKVNGKQNEN